MANNIKPAANGLFVIILIFLKAELRINIFETDSQSPTLIFISFLAFSFFFFLNFCIFAPASPKQPAPENPPGWERSKGNRS